MNKNYNSDKESSKIEQEGIDGLATIFASSGSMKDANVEGGNGMASAISDKGNTVDGFRFSVGSHGVGEQIFSRG
jgi:hypothetical protein